MSTTRQYTLYPSLHRKAVFVSGGASGIGAALVDAFVQQGARVAFCDIDEAAGTALCETYPAERRPFFSRCDVRDVAELHQVLDRAADVTGPIRVLVNNAARDDRHALADLSEARWNDLLAVNLTHHVFATQRVVPGMAGAGGGAIINLGSISWLRGRPNLIAYTASKAAISGITRTLARELGELDIRVNAVLPGAVVTERQQRLWRDAAADESFIDSQCLKFRVEPHHVASMVLFLASEESAAITGQNLLVDAGLAQTSVVG